MNIEKKTYFTILTKWYRFIEYLLSKKKIVKTLSIKENVTL